VRVNAEQLRRVREAAGLSRERLGRLVDLSMVTIWRIETRGAKTSADVIGRWAKACGVGVETLYEDTPGEAA
jgi:transcriptional regulator with XRE-family HTH domain